MAGSLVDYTVKYKVTLGGPALASGDRLTMLIGTVVIKNGTDNRALDISADIKNLLYINFGTVGGYVVGYDYSGKNLVFYKGTATAIPLTVVSAEDMGALSFPFLALGF